MGKKYKLNALALVLLASSNLAMAANTNDSTDSNEQSFARIEALDQNIEQAGKEISSLEVSQKLANLQAQADKISMDFSVLRIYGFNQQFYAVLQFTNKTVMTVRQGDILKDRYKIVSILSNAVQVYDLKTKETKTVPFA